MTLIRNWETFVSSSRSFFDANRVRPLFHLIQSLDQLYHAREWSFFHTGRGASRGSAQMLQPKWARTGLAGRRL
jgi:hypothetical protein